MTKVLKDEIIYKININVMLAADPSLKCCIIVSASI